MRDSGWFQSILSICHQCLNFVNCRFGCCPCGCFGIYCRWWCFIEFFLLFNYFFWSIFWFDLSTSLSFRSIDCRKYKNKIICHMYTLVSLVTPTIKTFGKRLLQQQRQQSPFLFFVFYFSLLLSRRTPTYVCVSILIFDSLLQIKYDQLSMMINMMLFFGGGSHSYKIFFFIHFFFTHETENKNKNTTNCWVAGELIGEIFFFWKLAFACIA